MSGCPECGSPSGHNATCSVSIRERNDEIADLRAKLQAAERERDAWKDTAAQHCRNQFFYNDLVTKIGEPFGIAAKTSDDGSIQQDVLALKVPELVAQLRARASSLEAALRDLVAAEESGIVGPAIKRAREALSPSRALRAASGAMAHLEFRTITLARGCTINGVRFEPGTYQIGAVDASAKD